MTPLVFLLTDPVTFTLIPDGDHRLSRPEDLELLKAAVEREITAPPEQLELELEDRTGPLVRAAPHPCPLPARGRETLTLASQSVSPSPLRPGLSHIEH